MILWSSVCLQKQQCVSGLFLFTLLFCVSKYFSLVYYVLVYAKDVAKDIVFLLDGSDSIKSGFGAVCDFVQRVVEKLNVEESKYRISVVQYSDYPLVDFYLKTYSTKVEVLNAITVLKHKGGQGGHWCKPPVCEAPGFQFFI